MKKHKHLKFEDLILFENDDFIGVNKPPYISTLSDRQEETNILALARDYCSNATVCHRLDKETSGALVVAKTKEAYRHLAMQFENRSVKKIYHAVSEGLHEFRDKKVEAALYDVGKGLIRVDKNRGKDATTFFDSLKAFKKHTLLKCKPITGRTHQIRVHLQWVHAPIAGDEKYDGSPVFLSELKKRFNLGKFEEERPIIQRVALHAYSISFNGLDGERIKIEAPYPKDMEVLLKQLEKNR